MLKSVSATAEWLSLNVTNIANSMEVALNVEDSVAMIGERPNANRRFKIFNGSPFPGVEARFSVTNPNHTMTQVTIPLPHVRPTESLATVQIELWNTLEYFRAIGASASEFGYQVRQKLTPLGVVTASENLGWSQLYRTSALEFGTPLNSSGYTQRPITEQANDLYLALDRNEGPNTTFNKKAPIDVDLSLTGAQRRAFKEVVSPNGRAGNTFHEDHFAAPSTGTKDTVTRISASSGAVNATLIAANVAPILVELGKNTQKFRQATTLAEKNEIINEVAKSTATNVIGATLITTGIVGGSAFLAVVVGAPVSVVTGTVLAGMSIIMVPIALDILTDPGAISALVASLSLDSANLVALTAKLISWKVFEVMFSPNSHTYDRIAVGNKIAKDILESSTSFTAKNTDQIVSEVVSKNTDSKSTTEQENLANENLVFAKKPSHPSSASNGNLFVNNPTAPFNPLGSIPAPIVGGKNSQAPIVIDTSALPKGGTSQIGFDPLPKNSVTVDEDGMLMPSEPTSFDPESTYYMNGLWVRSLQTGEYSWVPSNEIAPEVKKAIEGWFFAKDRKRLVWQNGPEQGTKPPKNSPPDIPSYEELISGTKVDDGTVLDPSVVNVINGDTSTGTGAGGSVLPPPIFGLPVN